MSSCRVPWDEYFESLFMTDRLVPSNSFPWLVLKKLYTFLAKIVEVVTKLKDGKAIRI